MFPLLLYWNRTSAVIVQSLLSKMSNWIHTVTLSLFEIPFECYLVQIFSQLVLKCEAREGVDGPQGLTALKRFDTPTLERGENENVTIQKSQHPGSTFFQDAIQSHHLLGALQLIIKVPPPHRHYKCHSHLSWIKLPQKWMSAAKHPVGTPDVVHPRKSQSICPTLGSTHYLFNNHHSKILHS